MRFILSLLIIPLFLGACASKPKQSKEFQAMQSRKSEAKKGNIGKAADSAGTATRVAVMRTGSGLTGAAMSPLTDLNIRRQKIPDILAEIEQPYIAMSNPKCGWLNDYIIALDRVLGPDYDYPKKKKKGFNGQDAGRRASDAALNALQSEATGLIPFRGVIRYLSGAQKHDKEVQKAIDMGRLRRAYLKGWHQQNRCPPIPKLSFDRADFAKEWSIPIVGTTPSAQFKREKENR